MHTTTIRLDIRSSVNLHEAHELFRLEPTDQAPDAAHSFDPVCHMRVDRDCSLSWLIHAASANGSVPPAASNPAIQISGAVWLAGSRPSGDPHPAGRPRSTELLDTTFRPFTCVLANQTAPLDIWDCRF